MKAIIYPLLAVTLLVTSAATIFNVNNKIDDGYKIKFESKDPTGTFDVMNGTINFDENNLEGSSFDLSFPISSINTENKLRDKKAQTSEWFDAANYPNATFKSSSVVKTDKGYHVKGTMTIKGVSKSLTVPMLVKPKDGGLVLYGGFGLNRIDFKVGKPNGAVPDVMNVKFYIPISK